MARNSLHDIKPTRRVPLKQDEVVIPIHTVRQDPPREFAYQPIEPKRSSRYGLWYLAAILVVGFFFSISFLFEHATVTITPKSMPLVFDSTDTFTAQKDSSNSDTLVYTVMSLNGTESMKLPGTESKTQSTYASGTVVLYNAYTTTPYTLVKNTRLATPDNRIYHINSAATIPGYTKANGVVVPGSIAVLVTASTAGESANLDTSDFTLPGFAGKPQFTKVYGRTKTPISGGLSGTVYSLTQDAANAALGTLQEKLKATLIAKEKVQVPDGYIFYDGATSFKTDDSVSAPASKEKDIPLALSGTLTVYLIKQDSLISTIAEKSISQYNGEPITVPKLSDLKLVPGGKMDPQNDTSFPFTLSGSATVFWTVDGEAIKTLLVGKKKADFQSLLASVVAVDRAELVVKPFWKRSFPEDITKIEVVVK
jgi:hypothetical protein